MTKKPRRVRDRVHDMVDAIGNVHSDIGNLSKEQFLSDGKTQRAVIESLIVIGEAANRAVASNPSLEREFPDLWQQLRDAYDMRNVLTHEYFRVEPSIVWTTCKNNLPLLERLLRDFLEKFED